MTSYTIVKVRISEVQKDKLKKAFESNSESIAIRLTSSDLNGEDVIAITKLQIGRLMKAYEANKVMTIQMSRRQFANNMKKEGGFLTNAGWIYSIPNRNCFTCIRSWGFFQNWQVQVFKTNLK